MPAGNRLSEPFRHLEWKSALLRMLPRFLIMVASPRRGEEYSGRDIETHFAGCAGEKVINFFLKATDATQTSVQ